jgi:hypothetical protein
MFYACKLYIQHKYFMQTDEIHMSKCGGWAHAHEPACLSVHVSLYWYHLGTETKSSLQSFVLSF